VNRFGGRKNKKCLIEEQSGLKNKIRSVFSSDEIGFNILKEKMVLLHMRHLGIVDM
jgi:hypothetical protein